MTDQTSRPILVTGGTGTLGQNLVLRLQAAGHRVRVLSRQGREREGGVEYVRGDLSSGEGVGEAVAGSELILHAAGSAKGDEEKARNLVRAVAGGGVRHLVYISVVGADRMPLVSAIDRAMFGYFGAKFAAERVVAASGVPWTTLRSTQFHDFVFMTAKQLAKIPIMPVFAGVRFQPVDAGDVAERLVELVLGRPAGLVPEMGGPQVYEMDDLMRSYLRSAGKRRPLMSIRTPGRAAATYRAGVNLAPNHAVGRKTWEEFLAAQFGKPTPRPRQI